MNLLAHDQQPVQACLFGCGLHLLVRVRLLHWTERKKNEWNEYRYRKQTHRKFNCKQIDAFA